MSNYQDVYNNFSDKMDKTNQDYKDLLDRYKKHEAWGSGLKIAQSAPSYGEIAQGRPHSMDTANATMDAFTGTDTSDLAANKELADRTNEVGKIGMEATKGDEEARWHDLLNNFHMAMAKAAQTKADTPKTAKDLAKETVAKEMANPKTIQDIIKESKGFLGLGDTWVGDVIPGLKKSKTVAEAQNDILGTLPAVEAGFNGQKSVSPVEAQGSLVSDVNKPKLNSKGGISMIDPDDPTKKVKNIDPSRYDEAIKKRLKVVSE